MYQALLCWAFCMCFLNYRTLLTKLWNSWYSTQDVMRKWELHELLGAHSLREVVSDVWGSSPGLSLAKGGLITLSCFHLSVWSWRQSVQDRRESVRARTWHDGASQRSWCAHVETDLWNMAWNSVYSYIVLERWNSLNRYVDRQAGRTVVWAS